MLAGPDDGAQRFLYQDTAIEALRRVLAHVAVAAIMVRFLAEVTEQDTAAAHIGLAIPSHPV